MAPVDMMLQSRDVVVVTFTTRETYNYSGH